MAEDVPDVPHEPVSLRGALRADGQATRLAWSPDGSLLAVPLRDHTIRIYDFATGRLRACLRGHRNPVLSASWSPDGRRLASGGDDQRVLLWEERAPGGADGARVGRHTARAMRRLGAIDDQREREINTVAWSCGGLLASCAEDGLVLVHDPARPGGAVHTLRARAPTHCAWSPDGRCLAVGNQAGEVELWEPLSGRLRSFAAAGHPVVMLAWSHDGATLACAAKGGRLALWDPQTMLLRRGLGGHRDDVVAASFSADDRLLASKSRDDTVALWRTDAGWPVWSIAERATPTGWCVGLAFHPHERVLAAAGDEESVVRLWRVDEALCTAACRVLPERRAPGGALGSARRPPPVPDRRRVVLL